MEVWNSNDYKNFRAAYTNRIKLFERACVMPDFVANKEIMEELADNPPPDVCKTCYKAYGI
jgi:hypothetical protein